MAISKDVTATLDMAREGDLEQAIVVGKDSQGRVAFYTGYVDKEKMIALLERARTKLVNSMDV